MTNIITDHQNLDQTIDEILINNGLDFTIEKLPFIAKKNDQLIKSPYFGLYNTKLNKIIHSVKESYTISQNRDVIKMVVKGMRPFASDISIHEATSFNEGRKVFIQLKINAQSKVGKDTITKYITVIDSNDGSTGLSVGIGDYTLSCENRFFYFYKHGDFKNRHTVSIDTKIKELPYLIETALNESMKQINLYNNFLSTPITRELTHKLVNNIMGFDRTSPDSVLNDVKTRGMNMMDALYNNIDNQINDKGLNLWGLHSGVTRWTTHEKSAPHRENGRLESLAIGNNYKTNQQSLTFAKEILATA